MCILSNSNRNKRLHRDRDQTAVDVQSLETGHLLASLPRFRTALVSLAKQQLKHQQPKHQFRKIHPTSNTTTTTKKKLRWSRRRRRQQQRRRRRKQRKERKPRNLQQRLWEQRQQHKLKKKTTTMMIQRQLRQQSGQDLRRHQQQHQWRRQLLPLQPPSRQNQNYQRNQTPHCFNDNHLLGVSAPFALHLPPTRSVMKWIMENCLLRQRPNRKKTTGKGWGRTLALDHRLISMLKIFPYEPMVGSRSVRQLDKGHSNNKIKTTLAILLSRS